MPSRYYHGVPLDEMVTRLRDCYLKDSGWLRSADSKTAVDAAGEPVPWLTYPAIEFLGRLQLTNRAVFEFGSGGSTQWWRRRSGRVLSVEHDAEWAEVTGALRRPAGQDAQSGAVEPYLQMVEARLDTRPANSGLADREFSGYLHALLEAPAHTFDVVVIDGMARNTAAAIARDLVKPSGIVVFDNSERAEYSVGCDLLTSAGFGRIDFWGLGPINPYGWCTSVFLRSLDAVR